MMRAKIQSILLGLLLLMASAVHTAEAQLSYPIVDTNQTLFYGDGTSALTTPPEEGDPFYGQDAHYLGLEAAYQDNGDGTVTDLNTGLMWVQAPDYSQRWTFDECLAYADSMTVGGYSDWRLPTIKELYSLTDFSGFWELPNGDFSPWLPEVFHFELPSEDSGLREIDVQMVSSTVYVGESEFADPMIFGFNFADGRIKGYPEQRNDPMADDGMFVILAVRGGDGLYGINDYVDNGDGTVTDQATGLMLQQADDGITRNWEEALAYAENLALAGYDDWRLPNIKELQSIVDYTRAPDAENPDIQGAAIDPIFQVSDPWAAYYWSSTTHGFLPPDLPFGWASYIAFGRGEGILMGDTLNVHGAGCQRSDPKAGDPDDWAGGFGPQGDVIDIYNYVRCVRDAGTTGVEKVDTSALPKTPELQSNYPNPFNGSTTVRYTLAQPSHVHVAVFNTLGQRVALLKHAPQAAGTHTLAWQPRGISGGTYFIRLDTNGHRLITKAVYVK